MAGLDHGLDSGLIIRMWREIVNDSVRLQEEERGGVDDVTESVVVAIQGIQGSYSFLASEQYHQARGIETSYRMSSTFRDAVAAVHEGSADLAVLPIENTTSGAIADVYDALLDSDLHFVGDIKFRVRHTLVGLPGSSFADIKRIYCHPQAVAQCSEFIAELEDVEILYFSDTALSGQKIRDLNDPAVAAIASEDAARFFELEVLKSGIANREENYTRFVVVANESVEVPVGVPAKTSVVMAVGNRPGSLMRALAIFNAAGVNLVKLESRPIPVNPREELFYLDFAGNVADPDVALVLDSLKAEVRFLKVLGSYPSRDLRPNVQKTEANMQEPVGVEKVLEPAVNPSTLSGFKLGSRSHKTDNTVVEVAGVQVGDGNLALIAGPCAVESWDQLSETARAVSNAGAAFLRGGCFKPRTSPYSFQGLGYEGLEMLAEAGKTFGLPVVTEVIKPEDVEQVAKKADVLQIGTRNMQNFALLQAAGRTHRPVLLKRGMSSSIDELLLAAEYILAEGNQQVMLCERGIRTFENSTRNTLDISAVPVLKGRTHLPIAVDPSHAAGARDLVPPMSLAAKAIGADAIMVEIHPDPETALSDGPQSLTLDQFTELAGALGVAPRV